MTDVEMGAQYTSKSEFIFIQNLIIIKTSSSFLSILMQFSKNMERG